MGLFVLVEYRHGRYLSLSDDCEPTRDILINRCNSDTQ